MKRAYLLAPFVLSACATEPTIAAVVPNAPPVLASSVAPAPVEVPKACLPPATKGGSLVHVAARGAKIIACYTDDAQAPASPESGVSQPCVLFDPETGVADRTESYRMPEPSVPVPAIEKFRVERTDSTIKVCLANAVGKDAPKCSTVRLVGARGKAPKKPRDWSPDRDYRTAFADEKGERLFVLVPHETKDTFVMFGETYDVKKGTRISRVKLTRSSSDELSVFRDPTNHWGGHWVGNRVVLSDAVCCGPGAAVLLVDPLKGNMVRLHGYNGRLGRGSGNDWLALDGKSLFSVDVEGMKVSSLAVAPGEVLSPDETSADWMVVGGKAVLVHANPPGFLLVEKGATKASGTRALPLCGE